MIQMMPLMAVVPFQYPNGNGPRRNPRRGIAVSKPARNFVLVRHPSIRRQMIDHVRQILAEAFQQFIARHPSLRGQRIDLVGAECAGEIAGRDLLVRAVADP
jgi:hypothetical protein